MNYYLLLIITTYNMKY